MFNLNNIRFVYVLHCGISFFLMKFRASSVFQEIPMTHHAGTGAEGSTFTAALVGIAVRAVREALRNLKNRAEVRKLHNLDDRALKDIGLVRSDVDAALACSLTADPSQHLVAIAGGGRSIRRSVEKPEAVVTAPRLDRVRRLDAVVSQFAAGNPARA
jgi:uncharacterized protein YjiS (DUF1127 family)